ncbi:MAG TPA: glucosamine-6-phosphate deaminase [Flavobacteriaceae bacterium]|nr:glucosamine-6-phosphate deaminase [Flavobacteriaceae bacterium]
MEDSVIENMPANIKTTRLSVFEDSKQASDYVALQIATLIRERQKEGKNAILGLATGSTPKGVYEELVRMHQHEGLSFENVITFNLDEYYPIEPHDEQSYTWFMNQYLFSHVNINPHNIHIPHVTGPENHVKNYCDEYENKIKAKGGIDLQLLGIGRNGHIGFNEPGSCFDSVTRLINLHPVTRNDAQVYFGGIENVPKQAVSIGMSTISQARNILLLALGPAKSEIIKQAIDGPITPDVPASILQSLPQAQYIFDKNAAALL